MSRTTALRRVLRLSVVMLSLILIVGYSLALIAFVPNYGFVLSWSPQGELRVERTLPDHVASTLLLPGDQISAIDGVSIIRSPWRFLFAPGHDAYSYTVKRGDEQLQYTIPVQSLISDIVRWRLIPGLIGLGAWLVGVVILLLATVRNRAGWQAGLTIIGMAVVLAVSEAGIYGIPLAWLLSDPFLAIMVIAFAQLALIPGRQERSRQSNRAFFMLYGFAILLGLAELSDILFLIPRGMSIYRLSGIAIYDWILLTCALGLLLNPAILLVRFWTLQSKAERNQVSILLILTILAISPLSLLVILPRVLIGTPLIPWEVGFSMLILLPLSYGYVIYRRNFLSLDIVATRTLTIFLVLFAAVLLYGISSALLALQKQVSLIEPLPGIFAMGIAIGGALGVSGSIARKTRFLVFGEVITDTRSASDYAGRLARHPEHPTLAEVCGELVESLEVGQAVLWLLDDSKREIPVFIRGVTTPQFPLLGENLPRHLIVRSSLRDEQHLALFEYVPWAEVVAPLVSNEEIVGLLILGPKVPDNYYHSFDVAFVSQMAASMSITAENIRLFEASRAMSRELLRVREGERMQLATRLHDEPLQQITLVAGALDALAELAASSDVKASIQRERVKLLEVTRQLRSICADLHPPILDQGLVAAVEGILYEFELQSGLDVRRNIQLPLEIHVAEILIIAIYHVLIEALSNVRKHAQASSVGVSLLLQDQGLNLCITDDGIGIQMTGFALIDLFRNHHFGMVGMHEWARSVEGELLVKSEPNKGTSIKMSIPESHIRRWS